MKYEIKFNQINFYDCKQVEGKTVVDFLQLFKVSKKHIHLLFQEKQIKVNRTNATRETIIQHNDVISITLPQEEIDYVCDTTPATVVYEDDFVLIVHKPAGILIHDDKDNMGALANQVATYYAQTNQSHAVRYIHRLDEDTSGLVFFSKISLFQPWFDEQLANKEIKRIYYAVCNGEMKVNKKQLIKKPIGRDRHNQKKMLAISTGKEATTKIKCEAVDKGMSLIRCELETGRTHQIRVHLSSIGYPIVNDEYYGEKSDHWKGMGLYAYQLVWQDMITKENRVITDPILEPLIQQFKVN